jgi:hypothetical protein
VSLHEQTVARGPVRAGPIAGRAQPLLMTCHPDRARRSLGEGEM